MTSGDRHLRQGPRGEQLDAIVKALLQRKERIVLILDRFKKFGPVPMLLALVLLMAPAVIVSLGVFLTITRFGLGA